MAIIIGLTGGIGSGKTTVVKNMEKLGYKVYYSDEAGRKILQKKAIIKKIGKLFDSNLVLNDGTLDKKALANIVFSDSAQLQKLNEIIHPAVAIDFQNFVDSLEKDEIVIKESAILFETKADENCDYTILITAPQQQRIERVMQRDLISRNQVIQRMNKQMPEEEKRKKANFVINNLDLAESVAEMTRLLDKITLKDC